MVRREFGARFGLGALAIAGAAFMAGCSPVTYGTGASPIAKTVEGLVGVQNLFGTQQTPTYQARPDLVTPPSNTLPVPGSGGTPSNYPTDSPYTFGSSQETPPPSPTNLTPEQQTACQQAAALLQPPPQYCIPDPNAPTVTDPKGGGFFKRLFGRN